jgi:hypothetical protein
VNGVADGVVNPVHGKRPRRIPTSLAYWELKAEQVMNQVFAPEASIDLEIVEARPANPPGAVPGVVPRQSPLSDRRLLLAAGLAVLGLGLAGGAAAGWGLWLQHQQALRQERNLLLIERLRNLGPAQPAADVTAATGPSAGSSGAGPDLPPPPPPDEPWMQELATLPSSSAPPAQVLKVPMSQHVNAPPPPARGSAGRAATGSSGARGASGGAGGGAGAGSGSLPLLVGVVQIPGSGGSAIFQLGASSTSAAVGEAIGNSGWRLQSASGESAVIERAGEQRRLSISSGF